MSQAPLWPLATAGEVSSRKSTATVTDLDGSSPCGYEVILVDRQEPPSAYVCPVCSQLLRQPLQAPCGDRICSGCVDHLFRERSSPSCPVDGLRLNKDDLFHDVFAEREILSLDVLCPSRKHSSRCQWKGNLRNVKDHEDVCNFIEIKCPRGECSLRVVRNKLPQHEEEECLARPVLCTFCNRTVNANKLQEHVQDLCEESLTACPNGCSAVAMLRKLIAEHRSSCPLEMVACFYKTAGCQFVGFRKDLVEHHTSSMAYHMQLCWEACEESNRKATRWEARYKDLATKHDELEKRVEELSSLFRTLATPTNRTNDQSEATTNRTSYRCEMQGISGDQQSTQMEVCGQGERKRLDPLAHSVDLQVLERNSNKGTYSDTRSLEQRLTSVERSLALHDVQMSELDKRQDILDNKLTSGVLLWKIPNYSRRLHEATIGKTPSFYSAPFHTSPGGYRMCARLYPNGDGAGRGTHLSLYFVVMRSDYDSLLPWPFNNKVSLCILDQDRSRPRDVVETFRPDPTSNSFSQPRGEMNVASGCPLFLPQSALTGSYLLNDTLFVKVIVHKGGFIAPDHSSSVM